MEGWDPKTKSTLTKISLLSTHAGQRDGEAWTQRLKEEYRSLIAYTSMNKSNDNDWFHISAANPEGIRWTGTCWYVHNLKRYDFNLQFDIPVAYPATVPEIGLPRLDGKIHKIQIQRGQSRWILIDEIFNMELDWLVLEIPEFLAKIKQSELKRGRDNKNQD